MFPGREMPDHGVLDHGLRTAAADLSAEPGWVDTGYASPFPGAVSCGVHLSVGVH